MVSFLGARYLCLTRCQLENIQRSIEVKVEAIETKVLCYYPMLTRWDFSEWYSLLNTFCGDLVVKERSKAELLLTHTWRHVPAQCSKGKEDGELGPSGRPSFWLWWSLIKRPDGKKIKRTKWSGKKFARGAVCCLANFRTLHYSPSC